MTITFTRKQIIEFVVVVFATLGVLIVCSGVIGGIAIPCIAVGGTTLGAIALKCFENELRKGAKDLKDKI